MVHKVTFKATEPPQPPQQRQQLQQQVAAPTVVGTDAEGAATSSVTSLATSSTGGAPAAVTFTEVKPVFLEVHCWEFVQLFFGLTY